MTRNKQIYFLECLLAAFAERRARNASYSLRAFARDLGVAASTLSEVMLRRHGLSRSLGEKVARALQLEPVEFQRFMASIDQAHGRAGATRSVARQRLTKQTSAKYQVMQADVFDLVASWEHFAILEYAKLSGATLEAESIAETFGVSQAVAQQALDRLKRLGFLGCGPRGLKLVKRDNRSSFDIPSPAVRNFHKGILQKAAVEIERQAVETREYNTSILIVDRKRIPELKVKLRELRQQFINEAERFKSKDDVFCLSMQFFSVCEPKETK